MTTLVATTKILVEKPAEDEPGDGRTFFPLADGVAAQIGSPAMSEVMSPGGGQQVLTAAMVCDIVDGLDHTCRVTDRTTGYVWEVATVIPRTGLGLDHLRVGLRQRTGGGR